MCFGSNCGILIIFHDNNENFPQRLISIRPTLIVLMDYANLGRLLGKKKPRPSLAKGLGHVKGTLNGFRGRDSWYLEVQRQQICN